MEVLVVKKIGLIIPYFGNFNNYFNLFLNSCKNNPSIDFILFTNVDFIQAGYKISSNVKVYNCTFEELKTRIQKLYSFEISLNSPYKLCDFRPAYGDIFQEELQDYDFWGYCDTDLIFGDICKYLTTNILKEYDKIFEYGHLTIFKNNNRMRNLYKNITDNIDFKTIFQCPLNCFFDEGEKMESLCRKNGIEVYHNDFLAEFTIRNFNFNIAHKKYGYNKKYQLIAYKEGKLFRTYLENNKIECDELIYVHFLKRPMGIENEINENSFLIIPNKFINKPQELSEKWITQNTKNRFYIEYWIPRLNIKFIIDKINKKRLMKKYMDIV